jgi:hypothetical protein
MNKPPPTEDELLLKAVRRLEGHVLGAVLGLVGGFGLFAATLWLVLRGGDTIGPHLSLLGQFFYGYKVTVAGSFIGLGYGLVTGYLAGWLVAWIYNFIVGRRGG